MPSFQRKQESIQNCRSEFYRSVNAVFDTQRGGNSAERNIPIITSVFSSQPAKIAQAGGVEGGQGSLSTNDYMKFSRSFPMQAQQ
jgi:hypothetical protein